MVWDFKEELNVRRHTDQFGKPSHLALYDWVHTQTDLADGTVKILDFGECDSIGKICQLIDDFEPSELSSKLSIKVFLETDKYNGEQEY
jgi:hypothetical protein